MKQKKQYLVLLIILLNTAVFGQDISLFKQFNGRYDFVFFGNTLNPEENSFQPIPLINTTSSASLNLNPSDEIEKAYLYWAGSGTGDFEIKLNNQIITPDRTFNYQNTIANLTLTYFSAFKEVTSQIKSTGNGVYTLSELDVNAFIDEHFLRKTNFAGWAIIVIYKNTTFPLNQLNIYDGLQAVPDEINISLNSLNVIDNQDAKIGFLAWEGDVGIAVNETLKINGNTISNAPLNPANNAFNGTNSFTNSNQLYNMDLDVYSIQNNINIGDTSAQIQLTSNQDFVMINAIVTKLNSQLPDGTVSIDQVDLSCNSRAITVDYSVYNLNCTNSLPASTPISIYANGILIQSIATQNILPIDGSETGQITLLIPDTIPAVFDLKFVIDDNGSGKGIVIETIENNNTTTKEIELWLLPQFNTLPSLSTCNRGFNNGLFDFSDYIKNLKVNASDTVRFFTTWDDAKNNTNAIYNYTNFSVSNSLTTLYVRLDNLHCFTITSLDLILKNCPPEVYNFVSANGDGANDTFFIKGLRDVFQHFKISIYNRWGTLVWEGNNSTNDWDGFASKGILLDGKEMPAGTYYYVIHLNDPDYPKPLVGYLYLTR
jgi:gliding motility-associated-like protein